MTSWKRLTEARLASPSSHRWCHLWTKIQGLNVYQVCHALIQNHENIQMIKVDPSARNVMKSQHMKHWTLILRNTFRALRTQKVILLLPPGGFYFIYWFIDLRALMPTRCTCTHMCKNYCTNVQFRGQHTRVSSLWPSVRSLRKLGVLGLHLSPPYLLSRPADSSPGLLAQCL